MTQVAPEKAKRGPHVETNAIAELFEDSLYTEVFAARCHDTGESSNRKFKEFLWISDTWWIKFNLTFKFSWERKVIQGRSPKTKRQEFYQFKPAITETGYQLCYRSKQPKDTGKSQARQAKFGWQFSNWLRDARDKSDHSQHKTQLA